MPGTTTDDDPIAAANSARPDPTNPPPTSPRSRSSAGRSSAASSTNTSEPRRSPGQGQWPSYDTPQAIDLDTSAGALNWARLALLGLEHLTAGWACSTHKYARAAAPAHQARPTSADTEIQHQPSPATRQAKPPRKRPAPPEPSLLQHRPRSSFRREQAAQTGGFLEVVPEPIQCGEGVHAVDLAVFP